jgi:PAS domain S-box-containing protein
MATGWIDLRGHTIVARIHEGPATEVYKAVRLSDQLPVIVKLLKPAFATALGVSRFHHEYTVARSLRDPHIITAHAIESTGQTVALILEDIDGASLADLLPRIGKAGTAEFSIGELLELARKIVLGLGVLHAAGIIHRDIAPSNIVVNRLSGELRIVDLGSASTLRRETPSVRGPRALGAALAYIAPEQTGRLNRTVDYRADFYSLGAMLHELLTGAPPFDSADPMELVHAHLARMPVPPHLANPAVPGALSSIVMKLMAKAPEERYQSTRGLLHDLAVCEHAWRGQGWVPPFPLGSKDKAEWFLVPEKIYGRSAQVTGLMEAFERVVRGTAELVMVSGLAGIGKTALVNEIHRPVVRRRGYFAQGKFDQLGRGVPLSAFIQAFRDLLRQARAEGEPRVQEWKGRILAALGEGAGVLVEVFPELTPIIGPPPPVPELSGVAAENRFIFLFQKLIRVFASADHPLVVFLDDVQWADIASLKLARLLMEDRRASALLLIAAFREEEVRHTDPLLAAIAEIEKNGTKVTRIPLAPLGEEDITLMVVDTLGCPVERALPLSALVFQETRGNPFFSRQFLKALHEEGWIWHNAEIGSWECDIDEVGARARAEGVVEFMAQQMQKLDGPVRTLLTLAACIGTSFDLGTLALVAGRSQVATAADIWPALQAGLVLPESDVYRFYRNTGNGENPFTGSSTVPTYRFLHDHARQAAYSLIPPDRLAATHLQIGQLLLSGTAEASREENLFQIVSHLDRGLALLRDREQRHTIAELNLRAGRKAKAAAAYRAAGEYYAVGRGLLSNAAWEEDYALALQLTVASVETAYLNGDFAQMDSLAALALEKARTLSDRVRVYEVKIEALSVTNRMREAIDLGLQVLSTIGVTFPGQPSPADMEAALRATKAAYATARVQELIGLPAMSDPQQVAAMRLLVSISAAAFLAAPALYLLLILHEVRLSVLHGNLPASAFCYASYGLILCSSEGIDEGHEFGTLALRLLARLNAREWQCKVHSIVASFITHWKDHVRATLGPLRSAYHVGLEIGDFQFAAYSAVLYAAYAYFAGIEKDLAGLREEMRVLADSMVRTGQITVHQYFQMLQQAVHELIDGRESPGALEGPLYSEQAMRDAHEAANDRNGIFYVHLHKLLLHVLFQENQSAVQDGLSIERYSDGGKGFPYLPIAAFLESIALLAVCRAAPGQERRDLLARVDGNQEKLSTWARYAPMNHLHRVSLIEAERHRTLGRPLEAMQAYDSAISGAGETGHLRDEALANELAAGFYQDWGREKIALLYAREAAACWARWGASAKVRDLERRYPSLAEKQGIAVPSAGGERESFAPVSSLVDLATVIKSSQAIAGEIDLSRLLARLLQIAMGNTGAQRGSAILDRDGQWRVEAEGDVDGSPSTTVNAVDLCDAEKVPAGIVLAVAGSRDGIVLRDAAVEGPFIADPYIAAHRTRSVICMPLVNQGRLVGILYLENNHMRDAFAAGKRELLHMLSTQMALSLENALLYQKAQAEIAERRAAVDALRDSELRFHTIYDSINDAVMVVDIATGTVLEANEAMCVMFGYTHEEVVQLKVDTLSFEESTWTKTSPVAWLPRSAAGGPRLLERRVRHKSGRPFWAEASMRRATIDGAERLLVVVRDISGRKQDEEKIRLLNEELENRVEQRTAELAQANSELESFSYSVSHDLRAPLRAINGFARILEIEHGASFSAEGARLCSLIRANAQRMDQLISTLLSFSRLGRAELTMTAIDMAGLVASVLEELMQLEGKERLEIQVAELPPAAGDLAMMRQVWANLLSNALKFSSKAEVRRIQVDGRESPDEVVYTVRDNGEGFDMSHAGKLFNVFQRLHTENEFPGTGVGLAIVKRAVQRHGGRVWADAHRGQGAAFSFALPRKGAT